MEALCDGLDDVWRGSGPVGSDCVCDHGSDFGKVGQGEVKRKENEKQKIM